MTLDFGKYKVDIDIEKTRDFYKSGNTAEVCDCSGCANFMQAIGVFPEEVRAFFATIGVDLEKSAEIIPYNSEKNGSFTVSSRSGRASAIEKTAYETDHSRRFRTHLPPDID